MGRGYDGTEQRSGGRAAWLFEERINLTGEFGRSINVVCALRAVIEVG